MSNGVKFCRGTLGSFQTLKVKDPNTLYFITDGSNKISYLYLGDQLIVGGQDQGVLSITDLEGVELNNVSNGDLLTYNAEKGVWVNQQPLKYLTQQDLENYLSWGEIKTKGEKT